MAGWISARRRAFRVSLNTRKALVFLCCALALGLLAGAGSPVCAWGAATVSGPLVYDSVYGVFNGCAVMAKRVGETTDKFGQTQPVVQQDLVNASGEVVFSSTYAKDAEGMFIKESTPGYQLVPHAVFNGCAEILSVGASDDVLSYGLIALDGTVLVEPKYEDVAAAEDGSYLCASYTGRQGPVVEVYRLPAVELLQRVSVEDCARAALAFEKSPVTGEELLRVDCYDVQENGSSSLTGARYYRLGPLGAEPVSADEVPDGFAHGVTDEGEAFKAAVDEKDGVLRIVSPEGERAVAGGFCSCTVQGGYVVARTGGLGDEGTVRVFAPDATELSFLAGCYNATLLTGTDRFAAEKGAPYISSSRQCVIIDSAGRAIANIPLSTGAIVNVVGSYVFVNDGEALCAYDADGAVAQRIGVDAGDVPYLYTWDHGYVVETRRKAGEGYARTCRYFDRQMNPLRSDGCLLEAGRCDGNALPDGAALYVFDAGDDGWCQVVDERLQPVSVGGYQLAVARVDTSLVCGAGSAVGAARHGTADAFSARDENGMFGMVSSAGEVVLPFAYEALCDFGSGAEGPYVLAEKDQAWRMVDLAAKGAGGSSAGAAFTDVSDATPHAEDIRWLAEAGISTGWPNGDGTYHFSGMDAVVRQDMAAFLHRLAQHDGSSLPLGAALSFSDVSASTPHEEDIAWLSAAGIAEGWPLPDGSRAFRGMGTVARQDMAAFLYRLAGSPAYTPSEADRRLFSDVTEETPHAKEIWWLARVGVSEGWERADGSCEFRGMGTVARQDMAAFLHRMSEKGLVA